MNITPNFITEALEQRLIQHCQQALDEDSFEARDGRSRVRRFGYDYSKEGKFLCAIPEWAKIIAYTLNANSLGINEYPPGKGIIRHVDSPAFADPICIVSLGSGTTLTLEPSSGETIKVFVPARSLFKFTGEHRFWPHWIEEKKTDTDPATGLEVPRGLRYSLTFRRRILGEMPA